MLRTLYVRLSLALVGLFLVIGIALVLLTRYSSDRYYQEVTQRLNAPLAMYVAGEAPLIRDGEANTAALQALAHQAMVINPTVEVYLLDTDGRVLGHDLGGGSDVRPRVDLGPVRRFLHGEPELPLRGDDPRSPGNRKIFTAAEVRNDDTLEGFVYVVLGGAKYERFAASADVDEALRLGTLAVIGCVLFGLGSALLIFARLSRRLRTLTVQVNAYCSAHIGDIDSPMHGARDEIAQLAHAFDAMRARIDDQLDEIRATDRNRRELVAHVSHDLRTPLAAIRGYVETLSLKHDKVTPDQQRRYLDVVHQHTLRLGQLIDDLFELARLDADTVEHRCDPFCVAELVADVTQEYRLTAEHKGLRLDIDRRSDDSRVLADIGMIERVIANLLDNAIRHTPTGGCVVLTVDDDERGVRVTVADDGSGIPGADLRRVFERGFSTPPADGTGGRSSGLGLAIVKRILALHDAAITLASEPGKGSRFSFVLPRTQSAGGAINDPIGHAAPIADVASPGPG